MLLTVWLYAGGGRVWGSGSHVESSPPHPDCESSAGLESLPPPGAWSTHAGQLHRQIEGQWKIYNKIHNVFMKKTHEFNVEATVLSIFKEDLLD